MEKESEDLAPYAAWVQKPKGGTEDQKMEADVPVGQVKGADNTLNIPAALTKLAESKRAPYKG